jgi:hypothetical protein
MLPALLTGGRMAMQALPYITAGMAALPGLREGDIGKALIGGGLGYFGGGLGAKGLSRLGRSAGKATPNLVGQLAPDAVDSPLMGKMAAAARIGVPLAGAAVAAPLIGGMASGLGGGVSKIGGQALGAVPQAVGATGAIMYGQNHPSGQFVSPGGGVPGDLVSKAQGMSPWNVVDPTGQIQAALLAERMQQDIQLEGMKKIMPYQFEGAEARSKTEMQRQMAAAQIRRNIDTAAQMMLGGQTAAQNMGLNAANQMGAALTSNYTYQ